ncbi:hypothetical protein [Aquabacterium sp. OR-4]|uniref:hypothetical protein n=1 Tax=Aquabacterium sp. OR-4 TaxID=2978127 RepID=UPI0021B38B1E|nr:hypothetical protein [Aquabacterium sp. OR-4]MDT7836368.1 hypothetical protein [Aquabacterium sp. OR-4]
MDNKFDTCSTLHTTLQPIPGSVYDWHLNTGRLGSYRDGMNSRVHAITTNDVEVPEAVFKVTCCVPTLSLYEQIGTVRTSNRRVSGLPTVREHFGSCAQDANSFFFFGFQLDRLREARSPQERQQVQSLIAEVQRIQKDIGAKHAWRSQWVIDSKVARQLARYNFMGLSAAFELTADVIEETHAVLDLEQAGNILFDRFGYVCLADPVAQTFSC